MTQGQRMEIVGQTVQVLASDVNIRDHTTVIADQFDRQNIDDAFTVVNVGAVAHQHAEWLARLPRVEPFYAVKCNNDPVILTTLAQLGIGFDCASKGEIACMKAMGIPSERIIFANPCKPKSHLRFATEHGVDLMTFDNDQELYKVKAINPNARLVLRIAVSDPTAICQLNLKFGCDPVEKAPSLLKVARLLDLNVVGISFHVGSGCRDPMAYAEAITHARRLFDQGADMGHDMQVLDLGGGYPGFDSQEITFEQIADVINASLDVHFPAGCGTRVIAEPGRFYGASCMMSCVNVVAKSEVAADKITNKPEDADNVAFMYYVNDGVYGSFNCVLYDHVTPIAEPMRKSAKAAQFPCSIWGPTCDSMDCIYEVTQQPELDIGDWIMFDNMGAYTVSAFAEFNGFSKPACFYYVGEADWALLNQFYAAASSKHVPLVIEDVDDCVDGISVASDEPDCASKGYAVFEDSSSGVECDSE